MSHRAAASAYDSGNPGAGTLDAGAVDAGTALAREAHLLGDSAPLRLRRGARIVHRDSETLLGHGQLTARWLRLAGRGMSGLLSVFDGRYTRGELLAAVPETQRPRLEILIDHLQNHGLLEIAPAALPAPDGPPNPALDHLADALDLGPREDLAQILGRAKVGVLGSPSLARPLSDALGRYGVSAQTLIDGSPNALAAAACDLLLAPASGAEGAAALLEINAAAIALDLPLLPIQIDGFKARFGPLVIAGEGPCYRCLERRLAANQDVEPSEGEAVHPEAQDLQAEPAVNLAAELAAVEAVRVLVDRHRGHVPGLTGRVRDLALATSGSEVHSLLAVPFCPVCGPALPPPVASRKRPPEIPGDEVLDPLCGLVKTCLDMPVGADDPKVFYIATAATDSTRLGTGVFDAGRFGCGVDIDEKKARGAALGEILERYSAAHYDPAAPRRSSYADLEGEAVHPEALALFDDAQYRAFEAARADPSAASRRLRFGPEPRRFLETTRTSWVRGHSLRDRRPVWMPAPFVYLPYRYRRDESYLDSCLSTGVACGRTREEAVLKALYEVVERDATSIFWLARLSPRRLRPAPGSGLDLLWRERLETPGTELRLLDLTTDSGLPTAAAFLLREGGGTVVGSATRHSLAVAARKALLEAIQGQMVWRDQLAGRAPIQTFAEDSSDIIGFSDHARAYLDPAMRSRLDFLWRHPETQTLADDPQTAPSSADLLRAAVESLGALDLEPLAVDITSPDVRRLGYWVMRVMVPGMQPLNAQHTRPYLGGRRLREMPARLGLPQNLSGDGRINADPHPFP
ncbi:MAG: TOMM precursor leader peptide-binding protein [Acidobacteriota bacterium]